MRFHQPLCSTPNLLWDPIIREANRVLQTDFRRSWEKRHSFWRFRHIAQDPPPQLERVEPTSRPKPKSRLPAKGLKWNFKATALPRTEEGALLDRQRLFFFSPCTLPQKPAAVTEKSSNLAMQVDFSPLPWPKFGRRSKPDARPSRLERVGHGSAPGQKKNMAPTKKWRPRIISRKWQP